jgi:hypothetical protein
VFSLVLVLLLVWFVFTVVLLAWTLFFQGYIYSEPAADLWWRAPAAGTVLLAFLLLWVVLDYRAPGRYGDWYSFSFVDEEKPYPALIVPRDSKEVKYVRKKTSQGSEYLSDRGRLPGRPDKIIAVQEDGERDVFEPIRDAQGHFQEAPDGSLHYRDSRGREMVEGYYGLVSTRRYGWLLTYMLLNFLHLVVWFLGLWLLLRYQWAHALGLAVVFWGVNTLFVLPQVLGLAERVARERAAPPPVEARQQDKDGYGSCVLFPIGRPQGPAGGGSVPADNLTSIRGKRWTVHLLCWPARAWAQV